MKDFSNEPKHLQEAIGTAVELIEEFDELVLNINKQIEATAAKLPDNVPDHIREQIKHMVIAMVMDPKSHTAGTASAMLKMLCISTFAEAASRQDNNN